MRKLINLNDMLKWDNTILDDYVLPSAITITPDYEDEPTYTISLDHDLMSSNIIIKLGQLTPIFNEPDVFKSALNNWFVTHAWNIEHLMRLACQNYNPIENYDRWEHFSGRNALSGTDKEAHTGNDKDTLSGIDSEVHSGTTTDTHSGTDTTTDTTSAMNSSTYQPADKSTLEHGEQITTSHGETITTNYGKTDTLTHGENIDTTYGKIDTNTNNNHIHGNIGVMTVQDMADQEIALVKSFNLYDQVVSLIESDLFLSVY